MVSGCASRKADPFAVLDSRPYQVQPEFIASLENYQKSQSQIRSLSGRSKGTATEGRKSRPFKQVFALQLPDSIRIEIQTSVGQTLAVFVCDGETISFRQRDAENLIGPADVDGVRQTLGYELSPSELVETLLGRLPAALPTLGASARQSGNVVYYSTRTGNFKVETGFDLKGGVLRSKTFLDASGTRRVVVLYPEFTLVEGQVLPSRVQIHNVETRETAELALVKANLNPGLRAGVFEPEH